MKNHGRRHLVLLILLIFTWAISWPVIKVGVATVSPIWYACLRYLIATCCLFVFVGMRRDLAVPPRSDWPHVAASGVLQMGVYSALTGFALTILPAGRASVLAFSTPIWVVPLAGWWLHEYASRRAVFGVGLGLVGVLSVAAPSIYLNGMEHALAYFMLLAAAGAWAVTIVIVRAHRFTATVLALAPWQMLVAACLLLPLAIVAEGAPPAIGVRAAVSLAYVGPIATAFAYWAVVEAGRHIRASTMAMALLAAPTLGILISALALDEPIGASLVAGVLLIGMGIRLVTHAPARQADMSQPCNCSNTTEASADAP